MNVFKIPRRTTKEQKIAVRLSKKVKNFTGRGPELIKVKWSNNVVNIKLKWFLTAREKNYLENNNDKAFMKIMQQELLEAATGNLTKVFSEVFNSQVKIIEIDEIVLQEKLTVQVQVQSLAG